MHHCSSPDDLCARGACDLLMEAHRKFIFGEVVPHISNSQCYLKVKVTKVHKALTMQSQGHKALTMQSQGHKGSQSSQLTKLLQSTSANTYYLRYFLYCLDFALIYS